ncbi:MAG: hypothetical protein ACPGNV_17410 [Mangrovicoccus sp.]
MIVVCYIRHPAAYAISAFQQFVKTGRCGLADFAAAELAERGSRVLRRHEKALRQVELTLRPFDPPQLAGGDVVRDFFTTIGAEQDLIDRLRFRRMNDGLSHEALLLADAFYRISSGQGGTVPQRSQSFEQALTQVKGAPFRLTAPQWAELEAAADPLLQWLAVDHGLSFTPIPSDPISSTPMAGLWQADALASLAHLINDQQLRLEDLLRQSGSEQAEESTTGIRAIPG